MTLSTSPAQTQAPQAPTTAMLRCRIGRGQYLLPLSKVLEIIRYVIPTPVPQTASWVSGVMNLRGRVIPVIDLAIKFGEAQSRPDEWTCIVLVEADLDGETTTLGLTTSLVSEIHDLKAADLEPPPSVGTQIRVEFLRGLLRVEETYALALDLDRVLSASEQVAVRAMAENKTPS